MKTKKPRSKRAIKPVARATPRTRSKARTRSVKVATTRKPAAKRKTTRRRIVAAIPRPRVIARPKTARKRVSRRKTAPLSELLLKAEPQVPLIAHPAVLDAEIPELAETSFAEPIAEKPKRLARKRVKSPLPAQPPVEPAVLLEPQLEPEVTATVAPAKSPAPAQPPARVPELVIPPILFEDDAPKPATHSGPGKKYALGPATPAPAATAERACLPSSYGTGRMMLVARDPHWLYAHWDLSEPEQRRYNALSADRHLVVRVQPGTIQGHRSTEIHVHPESRHWFIHVDRAGTTYTAELGYYPADRKWVTVASSTAAATPPDTASSDRTVRFATVNVEKPLRGSLMRAPTLKTATVPTLDQSRERELAAALSRYFERPEAPSSIDLPELVRSAIGAGRPAGGVPPAEIPPGAIHLDLGRGAGLENPTSPAGGEGPAPKGFWLNLNAELVLYGATEPNATLLIDGYPVQLRPDGTFSYRFALPDGNYEIALWAMSADGDLRQAILKFGRSSNYEGEVGAHPQDPALLPPPAENK